MNITFKILTSAAILAVVLPVLIAQAQGAVQPVATSSAATSTEFSISPATSTPLGLGVATTTASSTDPLPVFKEPVEPTLVLQPSVDLQTSGASLQAHIELSNLKCKGCEGGYPATTTVLTYYTPWYPNDGPEFKETGERYGLQSFTTAPPALKNAGSFAWSAQASPGRYYFVVVVDPDNKLGAYRMQRTEVVIQ